MAGSGAESTGTIVMEASVGRCSVCREKIVVGETHEVLVRNAILRVDRRSGAVTAKCTRCKSWVEVPLRYTG
jgi:hypothetical protein